MPMFGVIRLTFERDGGSMRGDEDFFSVARTMPLVAIEGQNNHLGQDLIQCNIPLIPSAVTP